MGYTTIYQLVIRISQPSTLGIYKVGISWVLGHLMEVNWISKSQKIVGGPTLGRDNVPPLHPLNQHPRWPPQDLLCTADARGSELARGPETSVDLVELYG